MKIGILTTFRRMPDSYSLVHDVKDQIKTLKKYNVNVNQFIRQAIKEKLQRDWKEIKDDIDNELPENLR